MKEEKPLIEPVDMDLIFDCLNLEDGIFYLDSNKLAEVSSDLVEMLDMNPEEFFKNIEGEIFIRYGFCNEVRILNNMNKRDIKELRSRDLGKLITIKGVIRRLTKVMPRTTCIRYECPGCGTIITVIQNKKTIKEPNRCSCNRTSNFKELGRDIIDIQELNLESLPEISDGQPQQIRVLLEKSLVDVTLNDTLRPGRRIEVIGRLEPMPGFMSSKQEDAILSEFMIHANNIISLEESSEVIVTEEDEKKIRELLKDEPLKFLADNLAPEIHGHQDIKKALVLQMVKGVNKIKSDGSKSRGDIHILLAGDPGVAKSVLSKFAEKKSPGSRTIIGTRTTKASLGAMAVKDELSNTWALEIGPLVQCNKSVLYFDEIDKMNKDNINELLEPMSSSSVTVNKAGISATLPSETSVCASANPKNGNYDLSKPLARQIDIPSPILNRFDLVFVMVDRPDYDIDSASIDHVFNSYIEKIKADVSPDMFRKIISLCRKQEPILRPELIEHLRPLYVELRKMAERDRSNAIPINLRNIEALIRLSEAHAKLRMSDYVEIEDFNVAKDIFMFCLKQIGVNTDGCFDMSMVTEKIPTSHRGKINKLVEILNKMKETQEEIKSDDIYDACKIANIEHYEVTTFLNELKQKGELIESSRGIYKVL